MAKTSKKRSAQTLETHSFAAETSKVLRLMIHSLYTNKDIFLRELISNASDACDKLRYAGLTEPSLLEEAPELKVTITLSEKAKIITIADNGIGMNHDDLIANLGTIARSGTQEFIEGLAGDKENQLALIGQFGVGFYSAYMVAERVEVTTRKAGETQGWKWASEGAGEYTVEPAEGEIARGTSVTLFLREDAKEYLDFFRLQHIVKTYSDHIGFPISLRSDEKEPETVNAGSALWARAKSEIKEEQYHEFYHHVAHLPDSPWLTMHNKVEGKLSYTNLLFVPSMKPFDLFHPERRRRVKLYVKRVFITEENIDLVPHYLRFLRGIIDSEDLPLNISRETLQDNPLLRQIRESITSKVLGELSKKAEKDPEGFKTFWGNFGAVLKEGLCEATSPRDKLLEVCRFYSTQGDALISIDDYLSRMKEGQSEIYYLTGDNLAALRHSPVLEGFIKRGVEVLLLTDHVDDFWVNTVPQIHGKALKSITRSNIDLDAFAPLPKEDAAPEAAKSEQKDQIAGLIAHLKTLFGEQIKDVRTTTKLTETPACLSVDDYAMDFRMERFLMEHNQLPKRAAKILELNAAHPLVEKLAGMLAGGTDTTALDDAAWLLLDQARIAEGETIDDPAAFVKRLSHALQRSLAV